MEKIIKIINEMQKKGLFKEYAIAGGIAVIFYVEPILTYDLDIFFIMSEEKKGIINLSPIYKYLQNKGYTVNKEHINIENMPVQFIPVYNELVKEAVKNAIEINYKKTKTMILKKEYLLAIMLQTFRPKDKERIIKLLEEAKINMKCLKDILKKYNLNIKFKDFLKVYYGK